MEVFIRHDVYPNPRASFCRRATGMLAAGATAGALEAGPLTGTVPATSSAASSTAAPGIPTFAETFAEQLLPGRNGLSLIGLVSSLASGAGVDPHQTTEVLVLVVLPMRVERQVRVRRIGYHRYLIALLQPFVNPGVSTVATVSAIVLTSSPSASFSCIASPAKAVRITDGTLKLPL